MEKLLKKKSILVKSIMRLNDFVKGSVFEGRRFCGKKSCHCFKSKTPHKAFFLSFKYEGKTKLIPIKKEQIVKIKQKISNYKKLKKHIDELAYVNSELLRHEKD